MAAPSVVLGAQNKDGRLCRIFKITGGVGNLKHLAEGVTRGGADAVLAASIFHFGEYSIQEAKTFMRAQGIPVRLN